MTAKRPTKAQAALIRYFAKGTHPPASSMVNNQTYRVCREEGWIEMIDRWPYHQATDKGRKAIGWEPS
jgi:hypothetical protein